MLKESPLETTGQKVLCYLISALPSIHKDIFAGTNENIHCVPSNPLAIKGTT